VPTFSLDRRLRVAGILRAFFSELYFRFDETVVLS
jgi:hypothetical protein